MDLRSLAFAAALVAGLAWDPEAAAQATGADTRASARVLTLWRDGDAGSRLEIRGRVTDAGGDPVEGAEVHVRQADGTGTYTGAYQGVMITDARGEYVLRTARPGNYGRPQHIHVTVVHPSAGYASTEILFKGDPMLAAEDVEHAIALETVRLGDREHEVGTFDIRLGN